MKRNETLDAETRKNAKVAVGVSFIIVGLMAIMLMVPHRLPKTIGEETNLGCFVGVVFILAIFAMWGIVALRERLWEAITLAENAQHVVNQFLRLEALQARLEELATLAHEAHLESVRLQGEAAADLSDEPDLEKRRSEAEAVFRRRQEDFCDTVRSLQYLLRAVGLPEWADWVRVKDNGDPSFKLYVKKEPAGASTT